MVSLLANMIISHRTDWTGVKCLKMTNGGEEAIDLGDHDDLLHVSWSIADHGKIMLVVFFSSFYRSGMDPMYDRILVFVVSPILSNPCEMHRITVNIDDPIKFSRSGTTRSCGSYYEVAGRGPVMCLCQKRTECRHRRVLLRQHQEVDVRPDLDGRPIRDLAHLELNAVLREVGGPSGGESSCII
jgi:hypothetical protein